MRRFRLPGWPGFVWTFPWPRPVPGRLRPVSRLSRLVAILVACLAGLVLPVHGVSPVIVRQPSPRDVAAGASLLAEVEVSGDEPLAVQWYRDGIPVPGATRGLLEIQDAKRTNSALYHAVITNAQGAVTSRVVSLTVDLPGSELVLRPRGQLFNERGNYSAGVQVRGKHAFVVHGYWPGLRVIDIAVPDSPRLVAELRTPGDPFDIALTGHHALIADRGALLIVDVSDPLQPKLVRSFRMPGSLTSSVRVEGKHAFVGNEGAGLVILDISNPADPRILSQFRGLGRANGIDLRDGIAFVANYLDGVDVVDVRNPAEPIGLRRFSAFEGLAFGVAVRDSAAYLVDVVQGLTVVDLTNPEVARRAGRIRGVSWGLELAGSYLFMADRLGGSTPTAGVRVFNIGDPLNPAAMGRYAEFGPVDKVFVHGNRLFTVGNRFGIIDVDFTRLAPVISTASAHWRPILGTGLRLEAAVSGAEPLSFQWLKDEVPIPGATNSTLELAKVSWSDGGRYVIRASNPSGTNSGAPVTVEVQKMPQTLTWSSPGPGLALRWHQPVPLVATASSGLPVRFRVRSGPALMTDGTVTATHSGTIVLEAAQEGDASHAPVTVVRSLNRAAVTGELIGQWPGIPQSSAMDVFVQANRAYVALGFLGLGIVDVRDPSGPVYLGGLDTLGLAQSVRLADELACVAVGDAGPVGDAGLQVVNLADPFTPSLMGRFETPGSAQDVQVVGQLAYVADYSAGVEILDLSNPGMPVRLGGVDTSGTAVGVHVLGNLVYVADGRAGLQVLDVANPSSPVRLGGYDTAGVANQVQAVGDLAFVADGDSGLQVIDVSSPGSPVRLGGFDTSGIAYGLHVVGSLAYVADGDSGIQVLDVSHHEEPARVGGIDTAGSARSVYVAGNLAYVADGGAGLQIIRFDPVRLSQDLTFDLPQQVSIATSRVSLRAVSSVGLPVTFRVVSGPATVDGDSMSLTGVGTVVVRAEQAGDEQFLPAGVERAITVLPDSVPLRLEAPSLAPDGSLRFDLQGPPGAVVIVQRSPDLRSWVPLSTNTLPGLIGAPVGTGGETGFFRVILR